MIVVTTNEIPGKKIVRVLGLVRGNTIRCRSMKRDILAFFKHFVGGEIEDYTKLFGEAREQALDRMIEEAYALQANAIVCHRFASSEIMAGAAELLAYGTAVLVEDDPGPA
ncbi:MAG: YbjQ family protein [Planctomycetota bacterium]